jgi:hypothetical protein
MGVSKCSSSGGYWQSRIRVDGRVKYLGRFTQEVTAALVYDSEALRLHGKRAKLNFGPDCEEQMKSILAELKEHRAATILCTLKCH